MNINLKKMTFIKTLDDNLLTSNLVDGVGARVIALKASEQVFDPPVKIIAPHVSDTDLAGLDCGSC